MAKEKFEPTMRPMTEDEKRLTDELIAETERLAAREDLHIIRENEEKAARKNKKSRGKFEQAKK